MPDYPRPHETKLTRPASKNVFIVHGKDFENVKKLKAMLTKFGLNPIVLHEQPSGSRTIIEKLEKYSDVGYVFVILTPDDIGMTFNDFWHLCYEIQNSIISHIGKQIGFQKTLYQYELPTLLKDYTFPFHGLKPNYVKWRARPNVTLEFGYFIGLLGRDRVCCLHKGNVELPSDMHGIVYIPFKESVTECRDKIVKELKAVGYDIKEI